MIQATFFAALISIFVYYTISILLFIIRFIGSFFVAYYVTNDVIYGIGDRIFADISDTPAFFILQMAGFVTAFEFIIGGIAFKLAHSAIGWLILPASNYLINNYDNFFPPSTGTVS